MLLSFPIGYLNRFIKDPQTRLVFGFLTGFILQFQMYGNGKFSIFLILLDSIHIIIATLNTFLFINFFGRKFSAFYLVLINIAHLSLLHIRRMRNEYGEWSIGVDTVYMMSICKFSSIAFNYEDGDENRKQELKSKYLKEKY
jgi:hypothetical protein